VIFGKVPAQKFQGKNTSELLGIKASKAVAK